MAALLVFAGTLIWTAVAAGAQPGEAYEHTISEATPVAWFRLNDAVGSKTLEDASSSHEYTASNDGVVLGESGPFSGSKAGSFGGEAYAALPGDPLHGASGFTTEAWVFWDGSKHKQAIFFFGSSASNYMYLTPSSSSSEQLFEIATTAGASAKVTAAKLTAKEWEYVAVTETSAGTLTLYLNGKKESEVTGATVSPSSLGSAADDYLGKSLISGAPEFAGKLSNVAFYSKVLSAGEIENHYDVGASPVDIEAPSVSGTTKEGKKLKAKEGAWSGLPTIEYSYQWQRCYEGKCESISGAKEKEYTLAPADVGYKLRVLVTAKNSAGKGEAVSAETVTIEGTGLAPKNTELPKVEGEAREGQTLTANLGKWEGTPPFSYEYQWERCNSLGEGCLPISGATSKTYVIGVADVGSTLRVKVTVKGAVEPRASAASPVTATVSGNRPVNTELPKVEGEAREGQTLTATSGKWSGPEPIEYSYAWLHCNKSECNAIEGASGKEATSYKLTYAYVGETIEVEVTAKNSGGSTPATSLATVPVAGNPPQSTASPTIEGPAEEGETLKMVSNGTWTGTPLITYAYQWEVCNAFGEGCEPAKGEGAASENYKLKQGEVGHTLRLKVTAKNSIGSSEATSATTAEVLVEAGGAAVAWGKNGWNETLTVGDLGAGYEDNYEVSPVTVLAPAGQSGDLSGVRSVVAAGESSFALLGNGTVDGWGTNSEGNGRNGKGQLGDGLTAATGLPVPVVELTKKGEKRTMTGVIAIAPAQGAGVHGMALVNDAEHHGEIMTWGASEYGERGNGEYNYDQDVYNIEEGGPIVSRVEAIAVPGLEHVIAIAAGGLSDFALQEEKPGETRLWGWGGNNGEKLDVKKEGETKAEEEVRSKKEEKCKGEGISPKPWPCIPKPVEVHLPLPKGVEVTGISAGKTAVYAVLSNGRVLSWGENSYGQLGDNTTKSTQESGAPQYVCKIEAKGEPCSEKEALEEVKAISAGRYSALALLEGGEAVGWGVNQVGTLSGESSGACHNKNLTFCQLTPKVVVGSGKSPLKGVTAVSASINFSLALANGAHEGEVYVFGSDERGQLGLGGTGRPEAEPVEGSLTEKCTVSAKVKGGSGKKSERKNVKIPCVRYATAIPGLSDVGGISAGMFEPGEGHSLAFLRSGVGPPAAAFTVTPGDNKETGKPELQVAWRLSSPKHEYKLKWEGEPSSENPNLNQEQDHQGKLEEYETRYTEVEEALEEAQQALKKAEEKKETEAETKDKAEIEALEKEENELESKITTEKEEINVYEKLLEEEFPHKTVVIETKTPCEPCSYTVTEAAVKEDGKRKTEPLASKTAYKITLTRAGAEEEEGEAEVARATATTP